MPMPCRWLVIAVAALSGCGQTQRGDDVRAAKLVSQAVSHDAHIVLPSRDIACIKDEAGSWTCRFDTRKGAWTCTVPSDSSTPADVRCTPP
jgi:hypothetical protein